MTDHISRISRTLHTLPAEQIGPAPVEDPQAMRLQRMVSSIEAINVRIARLAIGLGVTLSSEAEVAELMRCHQLKPDLSIDNQREELRGLLVLRYGVETRYVDQVGLITTRQILIEAEQHLLRDGFDLGDDGIDLKLLFSQP
jgi:hypothetical protein